LVVAFSRAAVSEARGAFFLGDFDHLGDDERSGQAGANWVFAFVERVRFYGWENVVLGEFFSGVDGAMFEHAEFLGFLLDFLQVFLLPDVYGYCDDLGFVFFLEPFNEDGRVQSA
jgi:hypothetical protein